MKKIGFAFGLVGAAALVSLSVMAIPPGSPEDPVGDNVCICHQTQHHQNNDGNENENQKGVLICVDPNSTKKLNQHIEKHGDPLVPQDISVEECTGEEEDDSGEG